jgi:hypothetical protein
MKNSFDLYYQKYAAINKVVMINYESTVAEMLFHNMSVWDGIFNFMER